MKRAMIFIDGSNVFFDWNNSANPGKRMDIEKYINLIRSKYADLDIIRTYYFTSATPSNTSFLQAVNRIPYCEVITGRLQNKTIPLHKHGITCPSCSHPITDVIITQTDKGTDVNIAVEMLKHAYSHAYDVAILISRDADFSSVVKIIKSLGRTVELVLFDATKNSAQELSSDVDHITILDSADCAACEKN